MGIRAVSSLRLLHITYQHFTLRFRSRALAVEKMRASLSQPDDSPWCSCPDSQPHPLLLNSLRCRHTPIGFLCTCQSHTWRTTHVSRWHTCKRTLVRSLHLPTGRYMQESLTVVGRHMLKFIIHLKETHVRIHYTPAGRRMPEVINNCRKIQVDYVTYQQIHTHKNYILTHIRRKPC